MLNVLMPIQALNGLLMLSARIQTRTILVEVKNHFGYMPGDFTRDKDAVSSCSIMAEIAAWAKDQGKESI